MNFVPRMAARAMVGRRARLPLRALNESPPCAELGIETTERDRTGGQYVATGPPPTLLSISMSLWNQPSSASLRAPGEGCASGQVPILGLAGEGEEHAVYRFLQGVSIVEHKQSGSPPNPRVPVARLAKRLAHCHAAVPEIAALAEPSQINSKARRVFPAPARPREAERKWSTHY